MAQDQVMLSNEFTKGRVHRRRGRGHVPGWALAIRVWRSIMGS